MTDPIREAHVEKIKSVLEEMSRSKPKHKKDLYRHLWRLKKDLKAYDMYHKQAAGG